MEVVVERVLRKEFSVHRFESGKSLRDDRLLPLYCDLNLETFNKEKLIWTHKLIDSNAAELLIWIFLGILL